mmetsp:Transcript_11838/g.30358  ORF Transcript_11838/g.30358 Transcript_11838/m.30358 type:complete len:154 (-) Transcript_11838:587-1048(-)
MWCGVTFLKHGICGEGRHIPVATMAGKWAPMSDGKPAGQGRSGVRFKSLTLQSVAASASDGYTVTLTSTNTESGALEAAAEVQRPGSAYAPNLPQPGKVKRRKGIAADRNREEILQNKKQRVEDAEAAFESLEKSSNGFWCRATGCCLPVFQV